MATTKNFTVTGMSCGHCESAVRQEVGELDGVADISVSAEAGSLAVTLTDQASADGAAIIAAVDEAGFQASPQ